MIPIPPYELMPAFIGIFSVFEVNTVLINIHCHRPRDPADVESVKSIIPEQQQGRQKWWVHQALDCSKAVARLQTLKPLK